MEIIAYRAVFNKLVADALIDERRRLAQKYEALDGMLKYIDIEDIEPVLKRQVEVEEDLKDLQDVLSILN